MENLIIKGNEIKEPGIFGKTIYVIKGKEIREPGFFGRTAYIIDGNEIKETGFCGKTLFVIEGDKIKKYYKKNSFLGDVLNTMYNASKNTNIEKEKSETSSKNTTNYKEDCEKSQTKVQKEEKYSPNIEEIQRQQQIRERIKQEQERRTAINKKCFLIIGCIVVALLITIIIFISQLSSLWYFTELNNIEFHEEFVNGITMAKTKLIISTIAIVIEIILIIICNRKRKREINLYKTKDIDGYGM